MTVFLTAIARPYLSAYGVYPRPILNATWYELLESLETTPAGLTVDQAVERMVRFGPNVPQTKRKRALISQFLSKLAALGPPPDPT
jgi:hypothetical protein